MHLYYFYILGNIYKNQTITNQPFHHPTNHTYYYNKSFLCTNTHINIHVPILIYYKNVYIYYAIIIIKNQKYQQKILIILSLKCLTLFGSYCRVPTKISHLVVWIDAFTLLYIYVHILYYICTYIIWYANGNDKHIHSH